MRKITTILFLVASFYTEAQVSTTIDQNNVAATLTDVGEFFNNFQTSTAGYEIPKGSGKNAIYAASMWYGGTDINGQLKLVAPRYYPNSQDLWPGALSDDGGANVPIPPAFAQTIWTVSKVDIINHINNYATPGYVAPPDIMNWPAHGDISLFMDYFLAPFVDLNSNNVYEPDLGEYPCVKGDKSTYIIVNDKGGVHGSGGDPIGLEIHYMFYQYDSYSALNDITFVDAWVINRGTQTLYDFTTSFWVDADLGNYNDDYVGSDSTRNLVYTYNGDNIDEANAGNSGYGSGPPALGVVCLNKDISSAAMFTNGAAYPYSDPSSPAGTFNIMQGTWSDGSPFLNDQGQQTNFQYYGNPNNPTEWSEVSAFNPPGDRRMIVSVRKDDPATPAEEVLTAFEEFQLSFAIVYGQDSTNLASVNKLFEVTDTVQYYYDNVLGTSCFGQTLGITDPELLSYSVYPNPSTGTVNIDFEKTLDQFTLEVIDLSGRTLIKDHYQNKDYITFDLNETPGVYILQVHTSSGSHTERIVIE